MKLRIALAAVLIGGVSLAGCAPRPVDLSETNCVTLDKAMQAAYLLVNTREEGLRRAKDLAVVKQAPARAREQAEDAVVIEKIMPLVLAYRKLELEYNSRCPKPAPFTSEVRKKYPSRYIK